jgi:hypothetical protein
VVRKLESGWVKTAENLGASHFKKYLSTDTSFSQIHLAGQSLEDRKTNYPLVSASILKCFFGKNFSVEFVNVQCKANIDS